MSDQSELLKEIDEAIERRGKFYISMHPGVIDKLLKKCRAAIVAGSKRSGDFHGDAVAEVYQAAADRIEDYDRREAAGEDMSGEVRPRMPGGSDF